MAYNAENHKKRMAMGLEKLQVDIPAELKKLIGDAADQEGLSLNEYLAKVFSAKFCRPDLASIPRKKMGRPRKMLAAS